MHWKYGAWFSSNYVLCCSRLSFSLVTARVLFAITSTCTISASSSQQNVFMFVVPFLEYIAIISVNRLNRLDFARQMFCVRCEVGVRIVYEYVTWLKLMLLDRNSCYMTKTHVAWLKLMLCDWNLCYLTETHVTWQKLLLHDKNSRCMTETYVMWLKLMLLDWNSCCLTKTHVTRLILMLLDWNSCYLIWYSCSED
jgi:hypothetical protein